MIGLRRETIPEYDYTPFDAGWDTRIEGVHMSENPYPTTNWKNYQWNKGWTTADEAVKDAPEIN